MSARGPQPGRSSAGRGSTCGRRSTAWRSRRTDPAVRARLEAELADEGAAALHARLAAVDPAAAAAILPSNGRRIVRALEVVELTGAPFSATMPDGAYALPAVQVGLGVPRHVLDARIEARVERMWRAGLVDEVRELEARGLRDGRTAAARSATRRCCASSTAS